MGVAPPKDLNHCQSHVMEVTMVSIIIIVT